MGGLFSGPKPAPVEPPPPIPEPAEIPDELALRRAQRKKAAKNRGGYAKTVMSDNGGSGSGGGSDKLGAA